MNKHYDWIQNNLTFNLLLHEDEPSKSIIALHLLSSDLGLSGGSTYLERSSSDYLPYVRRCFGKNSFQEGLDWLESLQETYGMPIHPDLESRLAHIMDSEEVQKRFEEFDLENVVILRTLLPKIDALLDKLVEEKQRNQS